MNKILFIVFAFNVLFYFRSTAQTYDTLELKVNKIEDLKDCYIISTIGKISVDSIYLISIKGSTNEKHKYEKLIVGKVYSFCVEETRNMANPPDGNFRLRIKNTVVWKGGDEYKKFPLLSKNTVGLLIQTKDR